MAHPLVDHARTSIRSYLSGEPPPEYPGAPERPRGVFVSLHTRAGGGAPELRGCVGSIRPRAADLAGEVAASAVSAAVGDPRFLPLDPSELDVLDIEVYLLDPPEEVNGLDDLDPDRYGVIVRAADGRTGLLLPGLEGIDGADQQVSIARRKAGIRPHEPVSLERFAARVVR